MTISLGEHNIWIDGVEQSFHIAGSGPVCLVHSGGPGFHWRYMRMPRLEQVMTVVYIEPLGTGKSGVLPDGDYSMPRYAYYAHQVAEHIGARQPYFLGHSHGGFVGLQYALDYPEELGGLILYSSAPCMGPELGMEQVRQIELYAERWPERPEAQDAKQAWMDLIHGAAQDRESTLAVLQRLLPAFFGDYRSLPQEVEEWKAAIDFSVDPNRKPYIWDVRDLLNQVLTPTLILAGEHDFNCGLRWGAEMAEKIPGSQLYTFKKGGHMNHVETPLEFAKVVSDFVQQKARD
ncbi:alpha/beta fold hydrolase [Paenibacillus macerans]|uniref:alpha/beta fold hydrolase n=1 Tax=Paenibacillus macerans TaxID=44252 RepID=UPI003D3208B1